MTRIKYYANRQGNHIELLCFGHSGYATSGSDIVCAGISTLTQTLVAFLNERGTKVESHMSNGYLLVVADGNVKEALDFTLCGLKLIEDAYPIYLKVEQVRFPFNRVDYISQDDCENIKP